MKGEVQNQYNKLKILVPVLVILIGLPLLNFLNVFMPYSEKLWKESNLSFYSIFWLSVTGIQFIAFTFCCLTVKYSKFSITEFGFPNKKNPVFLFIGAVLSLFILSFLILEILIHKNICQSCFIAPSAGMRMVYLISLFNAGITEEFIFRSYVLILMKKLNISFFLSIPLSCISFTLIHAMGVSTFYYGYFTFGLLMSLLFVWKKNIILPISIHILYNLYTVFYCFIN